MEEKIWKAFCELAGIEITDYNGEVELGTLNTADGYEVYYIGDANRLNYESDVFYYKPQFQDIMDIIKDHQYAGETIEVSCYDVDEWFDEYEVIDWLMDNADEDKLEELGLL